MVSSFVKPEFKIGDRVSWPAGDGTEFIGRICQIHGKRATVVRENRQEGKIQVKLCHLFPISSPRTDFRVGDAVAHKAYPDRYYGSVYGLSGGRVLVELDGNKFSCFSSSLVPFTGEVPVSQVEYDGRVFKVGDRVFAPISVKEDAEFEIVHISRARCTLSLESQARQERFEIFLNQSVALQFVSQEPERLPILQAIAEAVPAISRGKSKASGWLENYTKSKRFKDGSVVEFPRVQGARLPDVLTHWYWRYRYEEKSENAVSRNRCITRAVSVSINRVRPLQRAIKDGKMIAEILELIKS